MSLKLKSRQWIVDDQGCIVIGEGRKEILEHIERTGSINQTAKLMKMSYKGVWGKIKATEKCYRMRVVDTDRKTGTRLTAEGKDLLDRYARLKERCLEEEDRIFASIFPPMDGTE